MNMRRARTTGQTCHRDKILYILYTYVFVCVLCWEIKKKSSLLDAYFIDKKKTREIILIYYTYISYRYIPAGKWPATRWLSSSDIFKLD